MTQDDEDDLWANLTKTVTPLKGKKPVPARKSSSVKPVARSAVQRASKTKASPPAVKNTSLPILRHGETPGVDKATATKFLRGQLSLAAKLDLHGHTQNQAHTALNDFILSHAARGSRCILVVTGKGGVGEGTRGVLRDQVPRWLNAAPVREKILCFAHAKPQHGGTGALYILLKRQR